MIEWRSVADYEGLYEVSDIGQVRSLPRKYCTGRILKPYLLPRGYLKVFLSKNGEETSRYVHHLVAEAFIGQRPAGMEVCHGPNGLSDNSVNNLYYGTHVSNNVEDKVRDGTFICGSKTYCAKLNEEKVKDILGQLEQGISPTVLADQYGVSRRNIRLIRDGHTWKHVPR